MREVSRNTLSDEFRGSVALVSCLSFEPRSLSVAGAIPPSCLARWLIMVNEDIETDISTMREKAEAIAVDAGIEIEYLSASKRDPLLLANAFIQLAGETEQDEAMRWVADITTMTHEMLLMLVAAADEIVTPWQDLNLVYNLAGAYSGDDTPADKWISRGIHEVRSVIGYPGEWSPGEPTTMVALPGFDSERMRRMVEEIEPDQLVVGIACPIGDRHAWSEEKNRRIAEQLLETRAGTMFSYPALEPFGAIDALVDALKHTTGNVLIAPLNSKVSTAAIGMLVRMVPKWQVCYASAFIYNLEYATPSDTFMTCSLGAIRNHITKRLSPQEIEG